MSRGLKAINQWIQSHRHLPIRDQWEKLTQKLQGHFAYYGITGNSEALERFRELSNGSGINGLIAEVGKAEA